MSKNYELGRSIREIKSLGDWKHKTIKKENMPIGIKTPLEKGTLKGESLFKMNFNIIDQIKDNLKNLVMTQKGERLGFPDYGTSLRTIYSNTTLSDDQVAELASEEIKSVVTKYMPNINLSEFYSNEVDSKNFSLGKDFIDKQSSILIESSPSIEVKNKNNTNLNKIYMIKISFNIPLINSENNTIVLFINNAI